MMYFLHFVHHVQSNSGTTAVCISIIDDVVVCVNVGDSRCMAGYCTKNNQVIPIPLSIDQNPIREVLYFIVN